MLNKEVMVYVCANTQRELDDWVTVFQTFFGDATTIQALGTWKGENEITVLVSHLYERMNVDFDFDALDTLIKDYKFMAGQDAVLVVYRDVRGHLF